MTTPVIGWIAGNVRDLTFCDIGGIGLNSLNERISVALNGGASAATMIDYRRADFPEWQAFRAKMTSLGVSGYSEISGVNLEDRSFPEAVGHFDFVHSTGIIYHAPAPMLMLSNLSKITRRFLVTNTVIVPAMIENENGRLEFPDATVVFLPALTETQRAIFGRHYHDKLNWPLDRFNQFAPRTNDSSAVMPWLQTRAATDKHFWGARGELSYSPYWWLFTAQAFRAAVQLFGFTIRAEHWFKEHALTLFCER